MADNKLKIVIETVSKGGQNLVKMADQLGDIAMKASALAAPFVALATAATAAWAEVDQATAGIQAALGVTEQKAKDLSNAALELYGKNLGDSIQDASEVITVAFKTMGDVGEAQLGRVAGAAISLRDTFGEDVQKSISAVKTLMDNFGLSEQQAFDFLAKGFQEGLDRSGDFIDSIEEYSTQFKNGGASAQEFFSLMKTGAQGGMLGVDKAADMFKEFRVRIQDGSAATRDALGLIGIGADEMAAQLSSGAITAKDAFQTVIERLRQTKDSSIQMQAGVGLLGTQFEDMGTDAALAIDLTSAKMSDLVGAADSLKVRYDTLSSLGQKTWRGLVAWGAKAVDSVNWLIKTFQQLDNVSQTLILTMAGLVTALMALGAVAAAWKISGVVMGGVLQKLIIDLGGVVVAARGATASLWATNAAFKALSLVAFLAVLAYTIVKVYEATQAFIGWREAAKQAEKGWQEYGAEMQKTLDAYDEFKDIPELPTNLTGKSQEELKKYRDELQKTKVYYTALYLSHLEKADERNFFGVLTEDAKAAKDEMTKARAKLDEIGAAMAKLDAAGLKKPVEAAKASKKAIEDFEKAAKKAYDEATKAAKGYSKEVLEWEDKIKLSRLSAEDKLRELGRKRMSDAEAQADIERQAAEKASAAKQALLNADYDLAEKLNKDSMSLYERLADADLNAAEAGVRERAAFEQELYTVQKQNIEKLRDAEMDKAADIKSDLDELAKARELKIDIKVENLKDMEAKLKALTEDETKTITIKTVEAKAAGGLAGYRAGGALGGYGGGDRIRALLEAGEFVIRKEAVKKYGAGFFHMLNNLMAPFDWSNLRSMPMPAPMLPRMGYQTGGMVAGATDMGKLDLIAGGQSFPVFGQVDVLRGLKETILNEKRMKAN